MDNALAPMMPRPDMLGVDPNMPVRQSPSPGMSLPTAVAPAPMQAPRSNALSTPMTASFSAPQPKRQNALLQAAVSGFQRGLDPAGWQAGQDQAKAAKAEGLKKQIALLQNIRALPMEQRIQALPQISQSIGKQIPPELMQDSAIDQHLALLQGEAGIAPSVPEPMSEYQRAQIALEQQKAQQPRNQFIQGPDGAISVGNLNDGTIRQLQPGQPKPDPANYDMVTTADGIIAVNKRDPKDRIRVGAAPVKGGDGGEGGGGPGAPMDPERIRLEREYAKSWDGVRNNFSEVDGQYQRLVALGNLAKTDKASRSAADLGLIVSFTKMLDPGSVAREGEVKLTQSAASLVDMVRNLPAQWESGQTVLPDATRTALLKAAAEMHQIYQRAYEKLGQSYFNTAKSYQYDPSRVMMGTDLGEFDNMSDAEVQSIFDDIEQAAASPTGSGKVPPDAAAELMRDPSPEAVAEFDDAFGPGMAQRVLNGSR